MIRFDRNIQGHAQGINLLDVEITDNWSISGIPNGGYLAALAANAMLNGCEATFTPIVTSNFFFGSGSKTTQATICQSFC